MTLGQGERFGVPAAKERKEADCRTREKHQCQDDEQ
jgi:hypothetical protein